MKSWLGAFFHSYKPALWDKMFAYLVEQYAGMLNNLIVTEGCFALDVEQYMDTNTAIHDMSVLTISLASTLVPTILRRISSSCCITMSCEQK